MAAIDLVFRLLDANALAVTTADSKAGKAKRNAEIMAMIDKYTVRFFHDGATDRVLKNVEDSSPNAAKATESEEAEETEVEEDEVDPVPAKEPDDPDSEKDETF
jgi:hypothetical protein